MITICKSQIFAMRRLHFAAGIILVSLAILTPAGRSQQPEGFLSINCGGNEFTDVDTNITWSRDGSYLDSATQMYQSGAAIPVTVNITYDDYGRSRLAYGAQDNTEALKTAMMFVPVAAFHSKYCYSLPVEENRLYLLRVMFPSGPQNFRPTVATEFSIDNTSTFNFSIDTTVIETVNLYYKEVEKMEVVVTALQSPIHVCLVPENNTVAAISSIELRPLAKEMYEEGREQGFGPATKQTTLLPTSFLRTVARLNFGGDVDKPSLRFPLDPYDRLWEPILIFDPRRNRTTHRTSFKNDYPNFNYPTATIQTAEEADKITFGIYTGIHLEFPLYFSMCFLDVHPGNNTDTREITVRIFDDTGRDLLWELQNPIHENTTWVWWNFALSPPKNGYSPVFIIERTLNSSLPAMINAFEAYEEIQPGPDRSNPNMTRVARSVLQAFSEVTQIDTNGDPCLPVQWSTMSCINENFFTLNLSNKGIDATLPFGDSPNLPLLDDSFLTLDLSSNKFHGVIPQAFLELPLTDIILDNNVLSGFNFTSVSAFPTSSMYISLDHNLIRLPDFVEFLNYLSPYSGWLQLGMENNKLSGPIPQEIGNVKSLFHLDLSYNELTGPLRLDLFSGGHDLALHLSGNKLTQIIPGAKTNTTYISVLDLSYNQISGSFPHELSELPNLVRLSLHHNFLTGEIPATFWSKSEIRDLQLQKNILGGMIPAEAWKNITSSDARELNLGYNNFTGVNLSTWCASLQWNDQEYSWSRRVNVNLVGNNIRSVMIPPNCEVLFDSFEGQPPRAQLDNFVLLGGNPWCADLMPSNRTFLQRYLCRFYGTDDFQTSDQILVAPKVGNTSLDRRLVIGIGVGGSFFILLIGCALILQFWKLYRRTKDLKSITEALAKEDVRPPFYKYEDLKTATSNFSARNALGTGAFGAVYKALQADGSIVAVKLLYPSEQNIVDFLKEMVVISGIKHRNLVQLKGCCVRDNRRFLIYEFAENKSLADALWGNKSEGFKLVWCQRLNICICVARGLAYLHEELHPKIIHRDIKPHNILLDSNWNAKIADFGLARPMHEDTTQLATSIGGTLGYFSPEYATFGFLSEKLDVYSFGIVALEIVSGRRCIDFSVTEDQVYLRQMAFKLNKEGRLQDLADQAVLETGPMDEILTLLKVALACLHEDPAKRPAMSQVVTALIPTSAADLALDVVDELRQHDGQGKHLQATFSSITFPTAYSEKSELLTSRGKGSSA